MQRRWHWLWAALAVALGCTAVAPVASAAVKNTGVLSMTPARRNLVGRPPVHLSPMTTIGNTTSNTIKVHVFTALVYQRLDGSFSFHETAQDLNTGRLVLGVSPTNFTLRPGAVQRLDLHWQTLPRGSAAVYPGLIIQGVPQVKGAPINTILRLLGVNFFQLPGHWPVTGTIAKITGKQAAPRVLVFLPRVRNTGKVHSQPRGGRCAIVDANGRVRFRAGFGNGVVLPGFAREFPIYVKKILPAGSYRMRCAMGFGTSHSTRTLPFKLSGPNALPTADLKLVRLASSGEIGGPAHVKVFFKNRGSKASRAVLKVTLARVAPNGKTRRLAFARFDEGSVGAGESRSPTVEVGGKLVKGNYRATVVLGDGQTDIDQLSSDFAAKPHRGFLTRLWDWITDHWWLWLLLLLLLIAWYLIWRERRRRREMEAELEAARQGQVPAAPIAPAPVAPASAPAPPPAPAPVPPPAPAPASAPAADGRVNLNTASADELMGLPGVGRRAAERIVAHREANGPFRSLDDLNAVEGFHSERIQRIADRASV